jgi:antitoxin component YwqK of YwqJK toxin-antitoxin module
MRIITLLLMAVGFCFNVFSQSDSFEKERYQRKYEQIDTTVYFDRYLEISNYIFGGIHSIGITVKRNIQGKKVSFYLDSLKHFHKNGELKRIQVYDPKGVPKYTHEFDKQGNLIMKCEYSYKGAIPFLLNNNAYEQLECYIREYKNDKIKHEGLYINKKEEAVHIYYNDKGEVLKKTKFKQGKIVD